MAITAVDAQTSHVMLMAEGHGLLARNVLHHLVWRAYNQIDPHQRTKPSTPTSPRIVIRANVFALREKDWGISGSA